MPNVVGERFQITIDKRVRELLGVKPGDQAVEWVEDGRLVVAFVPRPHNDSMLGIIKRMTDQGIEPIADRDHLDPGVIPARAGHVDRHGGPAGEGRLHRDVRREAHVAARSGSDAVSRSWRWTFSREALR